MNQTERYASAASTPKVGRFATLGALLHAGGSSARSSHPFSSTAVLLAALAFFALTATAPSAASATQSHTFSTTIGEPGHGAGQLSMVGSSGEITGGSGLAVDDETGDVYVADTANHRISEFDPSRSSGEQFVRAFGWEVDATNPEPKLQVCTIATGCQTGSSGSGPGELESPAFLAVDNSCAAHQPPLSGPACETFDPSAGDLYVSDFGDNLITKFDPQGHLVPTWGNNGAAATPNGQLNGSPTESFNIGTGIKGIAVDHSGDLWVFRVGPRMFEFDREGNLSRPTQAVSNNQQGEANAGIAIDGSGRIDFANGFRAVERFDPDSGSAEAALLGAGREITSLALAPSNDDLYADAAGASILAISHQCEPTVAGCRPTESFGTGSLSEAAGLAVGPAGTVYAANTGANQIAVFAVTLEANTQAATEVKATSAVLRATVDPRGGEVTTCAFQAGPSTSYGRRLPCLNEAGDEVGAPGNPPITGPTQVHAPLEGLDAGTTYHYRLRAVSTASQEIHSEDGEFETLVLPRIEATEATELTAGSATLNAKSTPRASKSVSVRSNGAPRPPTTTPSPANHPPPSRPGPRRFRSPSTSPASRPGPPTTGASRPPTPTVPNPPQTAPSSTCPARPPPKSVRHAKTRPGARQTAPPPCPTAVPIDGHPARQERFSSAATRPIPTLPPTARG